MAKIIAVEADSVIIETATGKTKTFPKSDFSFSPVVGEEVDIIHFDGKDIVRPRLDAKQEYTSPSTAAPQVKQVNKLIYCLLAFLLGAFGAHKFYAGKALWGVIYILLSFTGISSIIAFVELIIALCKKSDHNGNILI
ncbi:MAG: TM2 domain-containing protein [Clostridia bacterium]|nr:TM2 domain-containing protein [Clostridia bacterium]